MSKRWTMLDWRWKTLILLCVLNVMAIAAVKAGLWEPTASPELPPFDSAKCRRNILEESYGGLSLDELNEDIQFDIRQKCSRDRLDYQGY